MEAPYLSAVEANWLHRCAAGKGSNLLACVGVPIVDEDKVELTLRCKLRENKFKKDISPELLGHYNVIGAMNDAIPAERGGASIHPGSDGVVRRGMQFGIPIYGAVTK